MVEPTGSEKASSIVFQLHLEGSETSQMSQRNSSKPICVFWPACPVTLRNLTVIGIALVVHIPTENAFHCIVSVATANESRNGEGEVLTEIQFSRLEALDPQKRELLEARFHTPRVR